MTFTLPLRLLVEVTFHYDDRRVQYLFQAIRGLAGFPVQRMDIVVSTNVDDASLLDRIRSLCVPLLGRSPCGDVNGRALAIESHPHLSDPWFLPWCHKRLIVDRFLAEGSLFTHFIHIEDDLLLSVDNLLYFVKYAETLRPHRLIPAFQRVEYNKAANQLRLVDSGVIDFGARAKVFVDDWAFVNPDYPHQAMFILDKAQAQEYVQSRSFDQVRSMEMRPDWGLCERAGMGLCFESPPEGFWSRYVIPVQVNTLRTPSWSWIYHLPNNYTENPCTPFGKIQPDQLFSTEPDSVAWSHPGRLSNLVWKLQSVPARLLRRKRNTGHDLVRPGLCWLCGQKPSALRPCARPNCPMVETARRAGPA